MLKPGKAPADVLPRVGPEWVKQGPRNARTKALLACAVSSDGNILAVGGGDRRVHVWDLKTQTLIKSFPGHKDTITGKILFLQFLCMSWGLHISP